jgi:anaerobic ribonucleoside-triphosphate reductase activating protein
MIMKEYPYVTDITFSGGDPFMSARQLAVLGRALKMSGFKTLWVYTGHIFENLIQQKDPYIHRLLKVTDIIVDGPYIEHLPEAKYRGSENQRIIDVRESLKQGKTVLYGNY